MYRNPVTSQYILDFKKCPIEAGLGPVKSRQDDLKYCKIREEETNGMNFNNFFERATALKTILPWKTTLSGRSHQSTHPGKLSFSEFDLNKFSSCKSFMDCFDQQCLEYQKKKNNGKKQNLSGMMMRNSFHHQRNLPFSSPNQIKRWGLKRKFKANRPQCNGKNERVNQTLVAKLRCKVNSTTKTPWTKLLEQVTYEYNNSPHDVTGFPPAYLMFGTLPYYSPLPNQVKLNYPPIQQARQIAVNRTIKHHKINKQRYDRHYVDAKFKVGDLVLYQNFSYPNSSKLQSPYNGPFKVVRKLSNVTYEIDKPNQYTGKLTDIVHSTRLKPFHSKSNFQLC
ncbi:transposon Ty3-G Gag-Pol polyprotein [Trichonephila clavipes]|nr:transposon Ty3-G Gag-Pol polyprotein [Trichonephila clavipes]